MSVAGFKAAAVAAGLRYKNRLDVGLIVADEAATVAGVFTLNRVAAAPVVWSKETVARRRARAILVNAGQANACTGAEGLAAAKRSAQAVARSIGCSEEDVLLASTGVIGQALNIEGLEACMPALAAGLSPDNLPRVVEAMMTTDTRPKLVRREGTIQGRPFTVVGMAKGSGMICPNMATMLSFVLTDAAVDADLLQAMLGGAVDKTFNCVTVDGDTSTNDCVFVLASGQAGNSMLTSTDDPSDRPAFEAALTDVLAELAAMIAADGEGATKFVRVRVMGAVDDGQAKTAALTVANSPLVKTAWFGQDANWGRIMGALGRSGAEFDPETVDIWMDDTPLVHNGRDAGREAEAAAVLRHPEFLVKIDLQNGPGQAEVMTCDFSLDYVKINADYRS